jgi:hypothetical protein
MERGGERATVGVAIGGLLRDRLREDGIHACGQVGPVNADLRRRLIQVPGHDGLNVVALEGRRAGQASVGDAAQGVHVDGRRRRNSRNRSGAM